MTLSIKTRQLGEELLESVWAIEKFRDKVREDLQVQDGDDLLGQLEGDMLRGDPSHLREITEKVGGISGLLGIVTEVVRLEELRNEALDRYTEARRADEAADEQRIADDAEDARTNVESYIERVHGNPTEIVSDEDQSDFASRPLESFSGTRLESSPELHDHMRETAQRRPIKD